MSKKPTTTKKIVENQSLDSPQSQSSPTTKPKGTKVADPNCKIQSSLSNFLLKDNMNQQTI
jgi:hypothetical protein